MVWADTIPAAGRMHIRRTASQLLSRLQPGSLAWRRVALALWALLTAGALFGLQRARLGAMGHPIMTVLAGGLLVALELWTTWRVEWTEATRSRRPRWLWGGAAALGLAARLLMIGGALYGLVEYPASLGADSHYIFYRGVIPHYWWLPFLALWIHPLASLCVGATWLVLVEILVVRRGWLRGALFVVVPGALVWGTLQAEYDYWLRAPRHEVVAAQPDVELRFDARALEEPSEQRAWLQSRDFFVAEHGDTLFASFGRTFGAGHNFDPNLWRVDLASGETTQAVLPQVRALGGRRHPTTLYAFPFHASEVLRFDKTTMDALPGIDLKGLWTYPIREATDGVEVGEHMILGMNGVAALLKIDTAAGRVADRLALTDAGVARAGDLCCRLLVDEPRATLYVITARPDHSVLSEVDLASFEVRRHQDLPFIAMHMTLGGPERGALYLSSEFSRALYRLDRVTWEARELGSVDPQARPVWDPIDDKLMILGFFDGTLERMDHQGQLEQTWDVGPHPRALQITQDGYYTISGAGLVHIDRP